MTSVKRLSTYGEFLQSKRIYIPESGFDVVDSDLNANLFAWQKPIAKWALRKGRAGVFLDCVGGETIIHSPDGDERIDVLAERGKPIRVWSLDGDGKIVAAHATSPFVKGRAKLYEVVLASGIKIVATAGHRFLTQSGWASVAELMPGECLAVSLPCHTQSNSALAQSTRAGDDQNYPRTTEDYQSSCSPCCRLYDEQLLQVADNGQCAFPSLVDVLERGHALLQKDDLVHKSKHIHRHPDTTRLSTPDSSLLGKSVVADAQCRPHAYDSTLIAESTRTFQQVVLIPSLGWQEFEPHQSATQLILDGPCNVSFDAVVSIKYSRTDWYYDLHVPGFENYLGNSIWSHNTGLGKTLIQLTVADIVWHQHEPLENSQGHGRNRHQRG